MPPRLNPSRASSSQRPPARLEHPALAALAAAILILSSCAHTQNVRSTAEPRPPNIVLVLVDDMGWTDLGCQGSEFYATPHIDALAAGGTRFSNAYAACAVCSPTRAAVLTGRYPARTGVTDWIRARFQRGGLGTPKHNPTDYVGGAKRRLLCPPNPYWMEHQELTIAELLQPLGYRSCHIGKWHLGDTAWFPQHQGFDENFGGCDYGQPPSYFDPYKNRRLAGIPHLPPRRQGEYLTDREGDEAVGFIRRNKDRPFLLYLAHYAVHTPIQAKPALTDRYTKKLRQQDAETQQKNAKYAAMVHSVDQAVGKVVAELEAQGLRDNTLILFSSDNGGLLGPTHNAPLRSGKGFPYEGGIRVPLIANWPGRVRSGVVCDQPACSVDLLPTITAACGVSLAADHVVDGTSLLPLLTAATPLPARDLFWHFPHYRGRVTPYSIIRRGEWKLIKRHEGPTFELFHLGQDLGETRNLATQQPLLVKQLDVALNAHLAAVGAKLPRANPDFGRATPFRPDPANAGKPRVLLLGDSISIGYHQAVRQGLAGKAAVFRPMRNKKSAENCAGTNHGSQRIDAWLNSYGGEWDVIHFNFGLHDIKHVHPETGKNSMDPKHPRQASPTRYKEQLRKIIKRLQATGASLVFATTTPVPKGVRPFRSGNDPILYNTIATELMRQHNIPVNDLFRFANARLAQIQQPRNVHFHKDGSEQLAGEVMKHIEQALARRRSRR